MPHLMKSAIVTPSYKLAQMSNGEVMNIVVFHARRHIYCGCLRV